MKRENKIYTCNHGRKMTWDQARQILQVSFPERFIRLVKGKLCLYDFIVVENDIPKVDHKKCRAYVSSRA